MNIQRKYSLPNCTLLLEGLSDVPPTTQFQELRPELSILVNAECYLSSYGTPISGGREFFESLVRAVSAYAQEFLSNIPNPQAHNGESELVELQKVSSNQHKLIVHPEIIGDGVQFPGNIVQQLPIEVDLNTVQLFDLVEAVDQFFADTQTLSELTLELQPVTRGYSGSSQAILKQAVPTTSPTAINEVSPTPSPIPSPTIPIIQDLEAILNTVPEITDPSQLRALNRQVYNQIHPVWENRSEITENLAYRLGVAADGSIIGYKAINKKASDEIEKTPLLKLLYHTANDKVSNEPIAQFKVVFTEKGELQVSPWNGYGQIPDVTGEKITDSSILRDLRQKLYNTTRQNWSVTPTFKKELRYRVAVNKMGVISDYEPLNQVAFDYFRETPLPQMFKSVYGSNQAAPNNKDPLAHFRVVFKPNGTLEVIPWQGYR
jgi:hypothetical protein